MAAAASPSRVIADDRSNSVLIGGEKSLRLRIKALIAHLDTPLESGGDTQVRYLQFADAEKIAAKLKEQISATVAITAGALPAGWRRRPAAASRASADRSTTIWAEPETNALVITAPAKVMRSLMGVVDKLDIRRTQVLVEAIIVDINVQQERRARRELGRVVGRRRHAHPGRHVSAAGRRRESRLAGAVGRQPHRCDNPVLGTGTTFGIGRIAADRREFRRDVARDPG